MLRRYAECGGDSKEMLLQKAAEQDKKHSTIINPEEFQKVVDHVDAILTEIEEELASHTGGR